MAVNGAFQPMGKTYKANATTSSQTITITANGPCQQLLVSSHESVTTGKPIYFSISSNSSVTCTPPDNGSPQNALLVVPGQQIVYTISGQFSSTNMYIAFITETGSGECYFTPGEGM
jgi:hypothetical protein